MSWTFRAFNEANQSTLVQSGGTLREKDAEVSAEYLSLMWFYRLEQVKPKQTAGSAPQRSALNTCVCDGAHHWLYYPSPGWHQQGCVCVWECVCVEVFLSVSGVRLLRNTDPDFAQEQVQRNNKRERRRRERQDLVSLIQLSGSQGYFSPLPTRRSPLLSSVAVIRKGRSKGVAECHCNVLALRAARV